MGSVAAQSTAEKPKSRTVNRTPRTIAKELEVEERKRNVVKKRNDETESHGLIRGIVLLLLGVFGCEWCVSSQTHSQNWKPRTAIIMVWRPKNKKFLGMKLGISRDKTDWREMQM